MNFLIKLPKIFMILKLLTPLKSKSNQKHLKPKQERYFQVFLRNIHPSVDLSDLNSELKNLGHEVCNVWNIKHRITKNPLPLFMVELLPNASNKHIYDIQYALQSCL